MMTNTVLGADITTHMTDIGDGTSVCWTSQGQGETVLLAMGRAWPKEMWWRAAPVLAQNYRVITFDNRGAGATKWNEEPFTIGTLAADAMAVLDAAGVEKAHVYGVSLGGLTVQEIALAYPHRTLSLILGCTGARDQVRESERQIVDAPPAPVTIAKEQAIAASTPFQYGDNPDQSRVDEDVRVLLGATFSAAGIREQSRAAVRYVSADRVKSLDVPTLVLHGTADKVVPYTAGVQLSELIPGAKLVTLEGAGHCYTTDATEQSNSAVLEFLAR